MACGTLSGERVSLMIGSAMSSGARSRRCPGPFGASARFWMTAAANIHAGFRPDLQGSLQAGFRYALPEATGDLSMRKLAHRPMCSALIGTVAALIAFGAAQAQAAGAGLALQRGAEFVDSRLIDVRDDRRDDRRDDKRDRWRASRRDRYHNDWPARDWRDQYPPRFDLADRDQTHWRRENEHQPPT